MCHRDRDPLFRHILIVLVALPLLLCPASSSTIPTTISPRGTLSITTSGNVTTVTMSNPPINLYDINFSTDMFAFLSSLDPSNRTTPPPKVVIFRSADPDFFISHLDITVVAPPVTAEKMALSQTFAAALSLLRSLTTTVFIAEVDGGTTAGGDELILQMDMRFAGPKAKVSALETSIGLTHAGGGSMQILGGLINKGRALQYLLSGDGADCKTGKELGWFNDCFESRKEMEETVGALAARIGLRPQAALNATKAAMQSLNPPPSVLQADVVGVTPLVGSPVTQALVQKFLVLSKNQTRSPFELGLPGTLAELYE
ncbi:unnamed protein product [Calypogeia fissa]